MLPGYGVLRLGRRPDGRDGVAGATNTYVDILGNYDLTRTRCTTGCMRRGLAVTGNHRRPLTDIQYLQVQPARDAKGIDRRPRQPRLEASYKARGETRPLSSRTAQKRETEESDPVLDEDGTALQQVQTLRPSSRTVCVEVSGQIARRN